MKYHRFIGNFVLQKGAVVRAGAEIAHQVREVLRRGIGDEVILSDGKGNEGFCKIIGFQDDSMDVEVVEVAENKLEPKVEVVLYASILKGENFEVVAQKATEAGVKSIVPIISKRTVKLDIREDRIVKIIREAAEQSGRAIVPVLNAPMQLQDGFAHAKNNAANYFFERGGEQFRGPAVKEGIVGIFIGPEGGWEPEEVEAAKAAGLTIAALGLLTLRAETAAIVASYLASN